jgi:hypothetical protein
MAVWGRVGSSIIRCGCTCYRSEDFATICDYASNFDEGNIALQYALHRVTMEMREWEARPGMMWVCHAEAWRVGMLRVHVCMEYSHLPFGSWAMMGLLVGRMLVMGAVVMRK